MKIREAHPTDLSTIADYSATVFQGDELFSWLCPRYEDYPWTIRQDWLLRTRKRMVDVGTRIFVAEIDGEVVGHAVWKRVGEDSNAAKWMDDSLFKKLERLLIGMELSYLRFADRAIDKKALKQYATVADFSFYKQLAASGYLHLAGLAVSPRHQRKGIGRELIHWGFDVAEAEQIPVTLEASMVGRGLYTKLGFLVIERNTIKDDLEGVAMLWEPVKGRWLEPDDDGNVRLKAVS